VLIAPPGGAGPRRVGVTPLSYHVAMAAQDVGRKVIRAGGAALGERGRRLWVGLALPMGFLALAAQVTAAVEPGVVVEEVAEDGAAHVAGLRPGDIVVRWSRQAAPGTEEDRAGGPIGSPFDLGLAELEQAPRGPVILAGSRNGEPLSVVLALEPWLIQSRPYLDRDALGRYRQAQVAIASGEVASGVTELRDLAAEDGSDTAWFLARGAIFLLKEGRCEEGAGLLREAAEAAEDAGDSRQVVWLEWRRAVALLDMEQADEATRVLKDALAVVDDEADTRVLVAALTTELGDVLRRGKQPEAAADAHCRALDAWQRLAPRSLGVARNLHGLAVIAQGRGETELAADLLAYALDVAEEAAPGSLNLAEILNSTGILARERGDVAGAEAAHRQALAIAERLAPQSRVAVWALNYLGAVATVRGDLAEAVSFHLRARAILERIRPSGMDYANTLDLLATALRLSGQRDEARKHLERAISIVRLHPGERSRLAGVVNNLGHIHLGRAEYAAALTCYREALAVHEEVAPGSLGVAIDLSNIGIVLQMMGDLEGSEQWQRRAVAAFEKMAPDSVRVARSLSSLGHVLCAKADWLGAEQALRQALPIFERSAPGTLTHAATLHDLGDALRHSGRPPESNVFHARALDVLESQQQRIGGSEVTLGMYRAGSLYFYTDYVDSLVEQGAPAQAFDVLERSRGQALLAMMGARRTRAGSSPAAERRPLDRDGVRRALDPGTVLLSYSITPDAGTLFVDGGVGTAPLEVFALHVGEHDLDVKVRALREFILADTPAARRAAIAGGRWLYDRLVRPAEARVLAARRVLVIPDGPLHTLPFAALVRTDDQGRDRYLVEDVPLHSALSGTVYAQLVERRRGEPRTTAPTVAVFADPRSGDLDLDQAQAAALTRSGWHLGALPASREEAQAVARVWGETATTFVGAEASSACMRSAAREAGIIHFAGHALLDPDSPLDSALVFASTRGDGRVVDDGLLRADEILHGLDIDADLVVLSACSTALGKSIGGEGLIGMGHAFLSAGARSLVASLWDVPDEPTAHLMERFHEGLRAGLGNDEALRGAQLALIAEQRQRGSTSPLTWAGFTIIGDCKH